MNHWPAHSHSQQVGNNHVDQPRIHLISPAGPCRSFFSIINVQTAGQLIEIIQQAVGNHYQITADEKILEADEDETKGGRMDDHRRAEDIEHALADDQVAAIVTIRGGAWFTRVLPLIDFSVMDQRTKTVIFFGFSELTPLANIIGAHHHGLGIYSMGPAFLPYGLRRHAKLNMQSDLPDGISPKQWMQSMLRSTFDTFFSDVISIIEGRDQPRPVHANYIRGDMPDRFNATFVGGNLTVLSTMIGTRYQEFISPAGHWLLLEDFNDKLERFDRFISHLTLAGFWEQCEGLLLGDFHLDDKALHKEILELLDYHIPTHSTLPIMKTEEVGHVWPMTFFPLHLSMSVERKKDSQVLIHRPPTVLRTV